MKTSIKKWMSLDPKVLALDDNNRQHVFTAQEVNAVNAALATGRPLLVLGEPGCGKSQLARAAAKRLARPFIRMAVDAQTESRDLLYEVDALSRLGRAHGGVRSEQDAKDLEEARFTRPGPLWWALNWEEALTYQEKNGLVRASLEKSAKKRCMAPETWAPTDGLVLLLDEIDKGDPSVPNGLLAVLGDGWFDVPGDKEIRQSLSQAPPLIVITTNGERTLPAAFLRRCLVLQMGLPKATEPLVKFLAERGRAQVPGLQDFGVELLGEECPYVQVAKRLVDARKQIEQRHLSPPGLAEYIDLLVAVENLLEHRDQVQVPTGDEGKVLSGDQIKLGPVLEQLERYALLKHPEDMLG